MPQEMENRRFGGPDLGAWEVRFRTHLLGKGPEGSYYLLSPKWLPVKTRMGPKVLK